MFHYTVRKMHSRIPKSIREKTILLWLEGVSRDEIARIVGIGAGSVSEIVKVYRTNYNDIKLEREYVISVKNQGYNIRQLEPSIRIKNRLGKLNWSEEQLETLLDRTEEHLFKEGKEVEVFIKEFEEFLENRPISQKLQMTEEALARVSREKNEAIAYLNRVNNRLDDFVLFPKTKKMISKIANDIINGLLKEFQIGVTSNQHLVPRVNTEV
jgi:hypothetical protein